jgi:hypothetical protein
LNFVKKANISLSLPSVLTELQANTIAMSSDAPSAIEVIFFPNIDEV